MGKYGLAIRWNDRRRGLDRVKSLGGVTVRGFPGHLRISESKVAVVTEGGVVRLVFKVGRIDGPRLVRLAGGQERPGYIIRAKRNTIHPPRRGDPRRLSIRWHAVGQFRYYNLSTGRPEVISAGQRGNGPYLEEAESPVTHTAFRAFDGAIPGKPRNHPEADLVRAYVAWLNDPEGFGHNYIREARLFVDPV